MSPSIALLVWFVMLGALLCVDPARDSKTSVALWVPVIWMFIVGSRLPSQWMGGQVVQVAQALEEGNSLDRTVYFGLIFLSIGILISRSFKWGNFLARNRALTAFLFFSLLSICWSDFAFVAFKRWFRDLGNYLVALVVLSDPYPLEAVRSVLRRVSYLLVPLSILMIKYYVGLSRQYDSWTGAASYVGATTSKNMLGIVCLISGLFFFWDTLARWKERDRQRTKRILLVNGAFLAMTLWLLDLSDSATSRVCLALGCLAVAAAYSQFFRRRLRLLQTLVPVSVCLYLILALGFDLNARMAGSVGRDATLHDRTKIWAFLLGMHTNPLIGTGYESFWLGSRIRFFAQNAGLGFLNEAHNGYLEVYLNLGWVGLVLLAGFVIVSYRTICQRFSSLPALASLSLAAWTIMLFHCITEADFRGGLLWTMFLMSCMSFPLRSEQRSLAPVARKRASSDISGVDVQSPIYEHTNASNTDGIACGS